MKVYAIFTSNEGGDSGWDDNLDSVHSIRKVADKHARRMRVQGICGYRVWIEECTLIRRRDAAHGSPDEPGQ